LSAFAGLKDFQGFLNGARLGRCFPGAARQKEDLRLLDKEAGQLELREEAFDLRECVEEALDLVSLRVAEKRLELSCLLEPGLPRRLVGDRQRLRQVLLNLLSNAVKFTERGEVSLRATARPAAGGWTQLHFMVRDTGIGISPAGQRRLFRSFSQVDESTTRRYGGTGLGLAISKRLSELMGGEMWV